MNKKSLALVLIVAMIATFTLTSCGGGSEYKSDGELLVVTEATFPPFDTVDEEGNITGFDMDLIAAIAEDQGFSVKFKDIGFDSLIPAINAMEADIIAAGMNSLDEDRQAKVDFSEAYYEAGVVLLVRKDSTLTGVDDLSKNSKIACQIGTTGADEANLLADEGKIAEAVILDRFSDVILQVINGDVQGAILDLPVAQSYIEKKPDKIKIVGETMNAEAYGFGVHKGNKELVKKINKGLDNVIENGTYDELKAKWGLDQY